MSMWWCICVCVYRCQGLCMFVWNATDVDGWLAGRDDRRMYMCVCVSVCVCVLVRSVSMQRKYEGSCSMGGVP